MPNNFGADESDDHRELVIGLDFGTSSVKVIVGDRSADKAFAVPFFDAKGIDSYLLPSRLWETDGHYSLETGKKAHRNLKLSLLASGDTSKSVQKATVFLALVLRHARAWLFTQHAEIYNGKQIVWKLVLGMPECRAITVIHWNTTIDNVVILCAYKNNIPRA